MDRDVVRMQRVMGTIPDGIVGPKTEQAFASGRKWIYVLLRLLFGRDAYPCLEWRP